MKEPKIILKEDYYDFSSTTLVYLKLINNEYVLAIIIVTVAVFQKHKSKHALKIFPFVFTTEQGF